MAAATAEAPAVEAAAREHSGLLSDYHEIGLRLCSLVCFLVFLFSCFLVFQTRSRSRFCANTPVVHLRCKCFLGFHNATLSLLYKCEQMIIESERQTITRLTSSLRPSCLTAEVLLDRPRV